MGSEGEDKIAGQTLGERDFQAQDRNEAAWQSQINMVTDHARCILNTVGTQDASGQHFSGKTYSIQGSEGHLEIADQPHGLH